MIAAQILIATDIVADAELVRKLLQDEFDKVFISINPDKAISDFEHCMPNVLILAFNSLEKAELYYLGLYRLGAMVISVAHRTIILCGTKELQRVYALCRKAYFDDYVLFWPMTNDVQRLPMAVTHALRDLDRSQSGAPAAEMARQVRRIAEVEGLLEQQLALQRESMSAVKPLADHFRPLVLVVDDDEFARTLAGELLSAAPYDLLFANNGAEALDLMREKRPDLILMDMVMPELNGLETLRRLKDFPRFADIPVMMITGQSEKDLVVECLKAGAVDFVVKPLERKVLLKKVERFLTG